MQESNQSALKEWAAIEQILASGASALLLRKGGIWEKKEGFDIEHREFWIFPTQFHQNPNELAPGYRWALQPAPPSAPNPDIVAIQHYAVVTDAYKVEDLERLEKLEGLHPLDTATVESRFRYRNRPYLHVMVIRLYRLPELIVIPNTLDYEGCVSWVTLDQPIATDFLSPVLGDDQFSALREEVASRLL